MVLLTLLFLCRPGSSVATTVVVQNDQCKTGNMVAISSQDNHSAGFPAKRKNCNTHFHLPRQVPAPTQQVQHPVTWSEFIVELQATLALMVAPQLALKVLREVNPLAPSLRLLSLRPRRLCRQRFAKREHTQFRR